MYGLTLNRAADSSGLFYFANGLTNSKFTAAEVYTTLVQSAEGRRHVAAFGAQSSCLFYVLRSSGATGLMTDYSWVDDAVRHAYRCALGRLPESSTAAKYWENRLVAAAGSPGGTGAGTAQRDVGYGGVPERQPVVRAQRL